MAEQEAPAAVAPAEDDGSGPIKVKLRKSVHSGDGALTDELTFREPTAGDIERCGMPVLIDPFDNQRLTFAHREMTAMMVALAGVPPSSIRAMDPRDWTTVAWRLVHFFVPA